MSLLSPMPFHSVYSVEDHTKHVGWLKTINPRALVSVKVSTVPVAGRHLLQALAQTRNRGNGEGGGIAAAGLDPAALGVSREALENDYLLAIAYLEPGVAPELEARFVIPTSEVDHVHRLEGVDD